MARRDMFTLLTGAGEEAIARLAGAPGADRLLAVAASLRLRVDELQQRMRALDELEARVSELERRVSATAPGGRALAAESATSGTTDPAEALAEVRAAEAADPTRPEAGSDAAAGGASPG